MMTDMIDKANIILSLTFFTTISQSFTKVDALPSLMKVGAIFSEDQRNSPSELAFKYAVHNVNRDKSILPDTTLVYNVQYVPKDDSFHASKKVCAQVELGVHAIFGPSDPILGAHVHSICDALDIPHLEARIDIDSNSNGVRDFSINLHPSQNLVNMAIQDVVQYLNWTKVAILFEKNYGMIKLRDFARTSGLEVHVRQIEAGTYMMVLNELKNKEFHNFIIDTRADNISLLLKGILELQMNEYKYHYLFTSFDIETFDLEDFKYNFVNITAFRLVDANDVGVREILKDMEHYHRSHKYDEQQDDSVLHKLKIIETESALLYDSLYIFAIGLQTLEQSHTLRISNMSCADERPWVGGLSLINYINAVEWKGLSGPIHFKEGRRIQFKLDLVKLKQHSIVKVGEWSPETRLNITDRSLFFDSGIMNVTLVVITILETPYVMLKNEDPFPVRNGSAMPRTPSSTSSSSGNHSNQNNIGFEGFCIDLLKLIAKIVGFEYRLELVPDGKYGVFDYDTKEWNGIVRQLMDKKADLAVGSMTINYARESVIDFTKPFMNLGISILFKVPTTPPTRLFSFMNPLAVDIWLYVLAAYVLVSITMYTVARFSPYEWHNPHPCNTESDITENQFTIANSFWFTIGTLMQQGSDLNPKATSTRIVSAIWWFFTLIIISSYTANLAAFLTVERMITPIENAEDLAGQTEISYGTLESGSTMTFFRDSMIETYKKMWRFMENKKPTVFTSTYEEGIKRVLEGNYAFLMESTMLDYIVQRDCNLTQIGGLLDTKGYGIATPMGSPWRDKISLAILELQEKGEIQMLYDKWWKNAGETCIRKDKSKESKANALGVDNIGGVFVVLLCGLAIAVLVAIIEFCHNARKQTFITTGFLIKGQPSYQAHQQQSLYSEMTEELCFALKCLGSRQRPTLRRQCSKCLTPPPPPPPPPPSTLGKVRSHSQQQYRSKSSNDLHSTSSSLNLTPTSESPAPTEGLIRSSSAETAISCVARSREPNDGVITSQKHPHKYQQQNLRTSNHPFSHTQLNQKQQIHYHLLHHQSRHQSQCTNDYEMRNLKNSNLSQSIPKNMHQKEFDT
ncbi:glutamate receptor ionotropic, kainate 2 isoform X1 [Hermetia illucens]|uniref:glutamate receptor ionotropic, kainate 2 isoform X1 n=1 Tax=Hermetia illucens TaxID=343691 RepID=UPI0018CC1E12|nr:glutamate receptor ionotropic, kainate 2 isoform X1 [Hermetia illucens]